MKKSEMVLILSNKLQKQIHFINSMVKHPKCLCDNLAIMVLNEIERNGMKPPVVKKTITQEEAESMYSTNDDEYYTLKTYVNEWEEEEDVGDN